MRPVLFEMPLTGAPVYSYGFMLGLALVLGWNLALYQARRQSLPFFATARGLFLVILSALVGARVLHLLGNPGEVRGLASWFDLTRGGIAAYGGFLGGTLAAYVYFGLAGPGFLRFADVMTPSVALGTVLTRIGCFLNGCDFGTPTALPWAVRFPRESNLRLESGLLRPSPAWELHRGSGLSFDGETVGAGSAWSLPVHPTQLYEAAGAAVLLAILMALRKRKSFEGELFLFAVVYYGIVRAAIEVVRGDALRGVVAGLSTSQFIGLATAALALAAWRALAPRAAAPGLSSPLAARR